MSWLAPLAAALSRDLTATVLDLDGTVETPVTLDWFAHRKGVRWSRDELATRIAGQVRGAGRPVGVMLHHAVTDPDELLAVEELVGLLARHPGSSTTSLAALASPALPGGHWDS